MNIYVSNLSFNVRDEDLKELFTPFGEVTSAKIINDRETGRSRGFGFVEMKEEADGNTAISQLNETTVDGRTMRVVVAMQKEQRSFGGSNSGGGNSGGYGNRRDNNRW